MHPKAHRPTFYYILSNSLIATVTNMFVWFALTFWVFLSTESVLATGLIAGVFAVANMFGAFFFGVVVDHMYKKRAMLLSSALSFVFYLAGAMVYLTAPSAAFTEVGSVMLWVLIVALMLGSVFGNLRTIALSTVVSLLFTEGKDQANGLIGMVSGVGFSFTSILSGIVIGFFSMGAAIVVALVLTAIAFLHLLTIRVEEKKVVHVDMPDVPQSRFELKKTIAIVAGIPGLFALIFFTTFNNFIGGIFMALMDAYGLSLVSVEVWGISFAFASVGFIAGSAYVAKKGLGKNPLKTYS
jgi:MFS transporter, DHA3 family, multidrug efflux protein